MGQNFNFSLPGHQHKVGSSIPPSLTKLNEPSPSQLQATFDGREASSGGKGGHENPTGRSTVMRYHMQETQGTSIEKQLL